MKPLDGTFAQNAEKWGVAGLWIDGGRIGTEKWIRKAGDKTKPYSDARVWNTSKTPNIDRSAQGRWPANLILDEEATAMLDEQSGNLSPGGSRKNRQTGQIFKHGGEHKQYDSGGGASRFFYCAKASKKERGENNNHPTVKPLKLMEYLCTLLKPPVPNPVCIAHGIKPRANPILLDPFCGSGTTLMAAFNTGWDYIGIDKEAEYIEIAKRRVTWCKEHNKSQIAMFA